MASRQHDERIGGARGVLLAVEGPDGAGKTTQARRLVERLRAEGEVVVAVREPGGTSLGERVRGLLLEPPTDGGPLARPAELFLFLASRAQLVREVIVPALEAGSVVVADRFFASTAVYQGFLEAGQDPRRVLELCLFATGGLRPSATLLLDAEASVLTARLARRGTADAIEARAREAMDRLVAAYRSYADMAPEPVVRIPAGGTEEQVAELLTARARAAIAAARGEGARP